MITAVFLAAFAGLLIGISRQVNGRLSLSTSPMYSSFINHIVGFVAMSLAALVLGGLIPPTVSDVPWWAYIGGPIGVIFVATGSWVIPKIGAVNTAVLIIGGQMISGMVLDLAEGTGSSSWLRYVGLLMILGGILLAQRPRKA